MGGARVAPAFEVLDELVGAAGTLRDTPLHADGTRAAACLTGSFGDEGQGLLEPGPGRYLRKPSIGEPSDAAVGGRRLAAQPDRDGPAHGQWRQTGASHAVEAALVGHRALGPQPAQEDDLLVQAPAPGREVLIERLVLHPIPADAEAEAAAPAGQDVHFGGLLGQQGCLPLGRDDDARHQLEVGDAGQEAVEHQGLVEGAVDVVGTPPVPVGRRIRADDMVVGQDVPEAQLLDTCHVATGCPRVGGQLGLRIYDAYLHVPCLPGPAGKWRPICPSGLFPAGWRPLPNAVGRSGQRVITVCSS